MHACVILYRTVGDDVIAACNEDGTIIEFADRDAAIEYAMHEFIDPYPYQIVELDEL